MMRDLRFADYFLYTQHSLATFDSCPLKFKKRYLENLKWNSVPDEEVRRGLEMGNNFHLLAYRYFMGIGTEPCKMDESSDELERWVQSLKNSFQISEDRIYLPEYKVRMAAEEMKLEANFDLLILKGDRIEIWDWKTHGGSGRSRKDTLEKRLAGSLQTVVYMFVLKEQSALIAGREIDACNISMHYWQPEPARIIAQIQYNDELHERFRNTLKNKINTILNYDYSSFDKELYSKHCKMCEFNWYCNNDRVDFKAMEEDDSIMDELEWDSTGEVF